MKFIKLTLSIFILVFVCLFGNMVSAATIERTYTIPTNDNQVPIGGSKLFWVQVSGIDSNAVITNVEAKFDYIAYGVVQNYVSSRFNRGSDPGSSGGQVLVSQGSLPAGNPGTYGYKSFPASWDGLGVNSSYYFRFSLASSSPYTCTIKKLYVRITYSIPWIDVTYPNGGETLTKGQNYTINWTSSNVSGNVLIHLYKGSSHYSTIAASTSNDGSYYPFNPSISLADANDYQICMSAMSGTVSDCSGNFIIQSPPKSDLVVQSQSASPTTVEAGSSTYISCTVKNQGSGSAASSYIKYYLSSNTTYDTGDIYFTSDYVSILSSEGISSESATVTIPSGTSTGTKYILFYADKEGAVSESDESNNVAYKAITVTEALPAPPTLSSPADGSTLPHGSNITFSWVNSSSSVSNSSIKVCTNTSMTTGCQFFETGLTQTIVSDLMFTPGVNYHWQARSKTSTSLWGIYGPTPAWSFTVDLPAPPTLNLTAETWTGSRSGVSEPTFPYDGDVALWLRVQNPGRTVNTYMTLTDPANGTRYCYYADNSLPTGDEEPPKILSFNSSKQAMFSSSWAVEEGDFLINRYVYSAANEPGVRTFTFWHEDSTTGERISEAEVSFSIQPLINPQVSVSPSFGPQGTTFQQPGTGFTPNGSVTLHFNGPDGSSTLAKTADSNGAYTSSWLCDACPAGTYTYYAVDNTTGQQSNTVTFTVTSQIFDTPFLTSFYRSYSTTDTDHFYTTNPIERDAAANNSGYTFEKVEAYISNRPYTDGVTLHRLYNSTAKSHYYTTSDTERNTVLLDPNWAYENAAGYVYPIYVENTVPVYHLYSSSDDDHFYTISEFERDYATSTHGYVDQGIAFYAAQNTSGSPLAGKPVAMQGGVDLSSGNFVPYRNHVDFANPSGFGMPFVFARTYNSANVGQSGPLGPGWNHNYQIRITDLGDILFVKWGDGKVDLYTFNGTDYEPAPGVYNELTKGMASYIITTKDNTVYTFEEYVEGSISYGKPVQIKDRNGITMVLMYDAVKKGALDHITDGSNRTYRFHYQLKDTLSKSNEYRLTQITEEDAGTLNRSISFGYDSTGSLFSFTDAENNTTTYAYEISDNPGLLTKITLPKLNTITASYDPTDERLSELQIGTSKTVQLTYDTLIDNTGDPVYGTVYKVLSASGPDKIISASHDQSKLGIMKDGLGNMAEILAYDANNNPTQINDKNSRLWFFDYHPITGNIRSVVNPENEVTSYEYDTAELNNLKKITDPAANVTRFEYDAKGNVLEIIRVVDGTDRTTTIDRYANGQVHIITLPPNGADNISATTTYTYDTNGYLASVADHLGNTSTFTYDPGGNLKTITYPGSKLVTYDYDTRNLLTSVKDWKNRTTSYEYTNGGRLKKITYPNGAYIEYLYDSYYRLKTVSNKKADGTVITEYTVDVFDELDAPEQVTTTGGIAAPDAALNDGYSYDNNNRISTGGAASFTHNDMGEILTRTANGSTDSFSWNQLDVPSRLQNMTLNGSTRVYEYDSLGNRVSATVDGVETRYVLDVSGRLANVIAETDSSGNVTAYYVHGLGLIGKILPDAAGTAHYYHYDRRGNTVALTDYSRNVTDQYSYDPDPFGFAMVRQGSTENPFTFVGRYGVMDEGDDVFYMRARSYDAAAGRFLNEDPIGFAGGDMNLYGYVGGNPMVGVDPGGLEEVGTACSTLPLIGIDMRLEFNNIPPKKTVITAQKDPWKRVCSNGICYRIKHKKLDDITFWDLVKIPFWRWKQIVSPIYGSVLDEVLPPYGPHPYYEIDEDSYEPDPLWLINCNNCGYPS